MNALNQNEQKKKKIKPIIIIAIIVASVVFTAGVAIYSTTMFNADMEKSAEYIQSGEYDKAKEILDEQLFINSSQYQVYLNFGDFYLAKKQYLNAVEILEQGLSKCSDAEKIQIKLDEINNKYATEIAIEKEQKKREEERKKLEEEKKKQEKEQNQRKEYISGCEEIEYSDLARNPNKFKGQSFKFTGKVIQVIEQTWGNTVSLRINVTKEKYGLYNDTIYATVELAKDSDRILEDDIITIYGDCDGLCTYKTVLGASVSVPKIDIRYYSIKN